MYYDVVIYNQEDSESKEDRPLTLAHSLLIAELDGPWVDLTDNPQGLISCNHSTSYTIIIRSCSSVGIAHCSKAPLLNEPCLDKFNFFKQIFYEISTGYTEPIDIFLARSFEGYSANISKPSARSYFQENDNLWENFFTLNFVVPRIRFINLKHNFFIINASGGIEIFPNYSHAQIGIKEWLPINIDELIEEPDLSRNFKPSILGPLSKFYREGSPYLLFPKEEKEVPKTQEEQRPIVTFERKFIIGPKV